MGYPVAYRKGASRHMAGTAPAMPRGFQPRQWRPTGKPANDVFKKPPISFTPRNNRLPNMGRAPVLNPKQLLRGAVRGIGNQIDPIPYQLGTLTQLIIWPSLLTSGSLVWSGPGLMCGILDAYGPPYDAAVGRYIPYPAGPPFCGLEGSYFADIADTYATLAEAWSKPFDGIIFGDWRGSAVQTTYVRGVWYKPDMDPGVPTEPFAPYVPLTQPENVPLEWVYPSVNPDALPIAQPVPNPRPVPWKHAAKPRPLNVGRTVGNEVPAGLAGTGVEPTPKPLPLPAPPGKGVKERKLSGANGLGRALSMAAAKLDDLRFYADVVDAFHSALPKRFQTKSDRLQDKLLAVYRHYDAVDIDAAVWNVLKAYAGEKAGGRIERIRSSIARKNNDWKMRYRTYGPYT